MPKRSDLETILVLGSGGIVIGQACEFDYSGTQAARALKAEGYRVILVNSNPATIMTDPQLSHRTYIEPLTVEVVEEIIKKERPCAILPTVGGQTSLNLAVELHRSGVLARYQVELLGATLGTIELAEDRQKFRDAVIGRGLDVPNSTVVSTFAEASDFVKEVGFPVILRPSYTLGGSGGGFAYNQEDLQEACAQAFEESPMGQALIEESVYGWKEFELEIICDSAGHFLVVCTIENIDPAGVHTGDSITVAPALTLSDDEYQTIKEWSRTIAEAVGMQAGGANVQFAIDPKSGRTIVIEMNPRLSRSSALASKATGYPIAKVAAKLAVGYTLDELTSDSEGKTSSLSEPVLDYVAVKIPHWDFAKFPGVNRSLGPSMQSVGEVMAVGNTFLEALQKGFRSSETYLDGLPTPDDFSFDSLKECLRPTPERPLYLMGALRCGLVDHQIDEGLLDELHTLTSIDSWFLNELARLVEAEVRASGTWTPELLRELKQLGFSDHRLATLSGQTEDQVRDQRLAWGILPHYRQVDICAGQFSTHSAYHYSTYHATEHQVDLSQRDKVIVLGSGPNRIGQGIEFDYCCVHASLALADAGIESVMINCNPETVSTDFDTSDRLYFEPLTFEDVWSVIELERSQGVLLGVVVSLGGQIPLQLARRLQDAGVKLLGDTLQAIERTEDREQFHQMIQHLGLQQPEGALAHHLEDAHIHAHRIGYPVLLRPSYVLGGRAMAVISNRADLEQYTLDALEVSQSKPLLLDKFLANAIEVDVDCLGDGEEIHIAGILQHIEEAGVHSGDSTCVLPPFGLSDQHLEEIRRAVVKLGRELKLTGVMNVQFAIQQDNVYVLEVNPRASRTLPFIAKATNLPLARMSTQLMLGQSLEEVGMVDEPAVDGFFVKAPLIPFRKFPSFDALLGPEMRSTGEVMGQDKTFGDAYAKSQLSIGTPLPSQPGEVLLTVNDEDKEKLLTPARRLQELGFRLVATPGTADFLMANGIPDVERVAKVENGNHNLLERVAQKTIVLVVNTRTVGRSLIDGHLISKQAIRFHCPLLTTVAALQAAVAGIEALQKQSWGVRAIQDWGTSVKLPL